MTGSPIRTPPSGEFFEGDAAAPDAAPGDVFPVWEASSRTWNSRKLPASSAGVSSVFGRSGAVVAQSGDYAASQVTNDSGVGGTGVSGALDTLLAQIAALVTGVSSVYGRTGAVVAQSGDYAASQVTNDSGVGGTGVSGALDTLLAQIAALVTGVSSVYGRAGAVVAKSGDYAASQVTNDSGVSGTGVSGALDTLAKAYPPVQWGATGSGNTTANRFLYTGYGQAAAQSSEDPSEFMAPRAGTMANFRFNLSASIATNWTVTIRLNRADSAVTMTINSGGTSQTSATTLAVAAGDRVSVKSATVAADASVTSNPRVSCTFGP